MESSLLVREQNTLLLLDVTRDFTHQATDLGGLSAVLLTHAHRDACGGLPPLRSRWLRRRRPPLPALAAPETVAAVHARFALLDHCRSVPVAAGRRERIGPFTVSAVDVPHAREARHPT